MLVGQSTVAFHSGSGRFCPRLSAAKLVQLALQLQEGFEAVHLSVSRLNMIIIKIGKQHRATGRKLTLSEVVTFCHKRFNVGATDQQRRLNRISQHALSLGSFSRLLIRNDRKCAQRV